VALISIEFRDPGCARQASRPWAMLFNPFGVKKQEPTGIKKRGLTGVKKQEPTGIKKRGLTGVKKQEPTGIKKRGLTGVKKQEPTGIKKRELTGVKKQQPTRVRKQEPTGKEARARGAKTQSVSPERRKQLSPGHRPEETW